MKRKNKYNLQDLLDCAKEKLFGLFMTRAREFDFNIQKSFRKAVYSSIK